ncbi:hypothetical protein [Bacillus sp. ISL-55]|uniref:hypothetical protein n=1 Tax=Bacillus sp. ISL-55 TaxID=2819134 RepID=UPI001BE61487|nr:hypothetical protein [Bacillus sp. ISL-55]MBT2694618.1 hypothetical protein [Bacillus sp. ISL-55]
MTRETVTQFSVLEKFKQEEVVERLIGLQIMDTIELYENTTLYLKNEKQDSLISSLKQLGEHQYFDNEFSIEEMDSQYWYDLCNAVLHLNDMIEVTLKMIEISSERNVNLTYCKMFLIVIAFIQEKVEFLYTELSKGFSKETIKEEV